jgi:hypothetical protein
MLHTLHAALQDEKTETNMNKTIKTMWATQTNILLGLTSPAPTLKVKRATYTVQINSNYSESVTVTAFTNPQSGRIWLGPTMDFYVDAQSNIFGGMLSPGAVLWRDSLISSPGQTNIDAAINYFEKNIDGSKLISSLGHKPDTDLRKVVPQGFFSKRGPTDSEFIKPDVIAAEVIKNELRLDLENPFSHQKVSVWIDISSRKPVKAVEAGKQIFPK